MNYYRKPINKVIDDVKLKMQLGALTLKLSENNKKIDDLIGVDKNIKKDISTNSNQISTNTSSISSNLEKVNDNQNSISNNLEKIDNFTQYILKSANDFEKTYTIEKQIFRFNKDNHFYTVFEKEIEYNFLKNSLLFVKNNMYYKYDNLSNDYHRAQHEYNIYDGENNLIHKYLFNKDVYYDESLDPIMYTNEDFCICFKKNYKKIRINLQLHRHNRHGFGNINLEIDDNDNNYINISYINKHNEQNKDDIASNLAKINTNTSDISDNSGLINTNTSSISTNSNQISTNTSSISSKLEKINDNKDDIVALKTSNVKAFYNLDKIFIYDIDNGYKTVNKDNHFHIFEKEITHNFIKNSYLEIALKVLSKISNYTLIGYFQILCNFYDQDDNLFYTISLSTAMGSINRLSTIKSVFIVLINEDVNKIKIDFFIAPKPNQQHRSAKFIIQDINSNKIYMKYFQKTNEMSIKNIQDSLNTVKNISTRIDNLEKSLCLKNLFNTLYHNNDIKVSHIFFDKTYTLNAKKNDFLEIYIKLLLEYNDLSNSKYVDTNIIFFNMENGNELFSKSYHNHEYKNITNTGVLLNDSFIYNFDINIEKLKLHLLLV